MILVFWDVTPWNLVHQHILEQHAAFILGVKGYQDWSTVPRTLAGCLLACLDSSIILEMEAGWSSGNRVSFLEYAASYPGRQNSS
jgi:hypothetical protein